MAPGLCERRPLSRRARPGFAGAGLEPARALPVIPFEPFQLGDRGLVAVPEPERVAGSRQDAVASVLGLGLSPGCKLVRNRLNLARDLGKLERIVGLHSREGRSLAPPTVEHFPSRGGQWPWIQAAQASVHREDRHESDSAGASGDAVCDER